MAARSSALRSALTKGANVLLGSRSQSQVFPKFSSTPIAVSAPVRNVTSIAAEAIPASKDETPIEVEIAVPFKGHRVDPPSTSVTTTPKELIKFFYDMFLMRRLEISSDSLYKAKLIRGFCHLYDGQEAVCVGMESALTYDDCIITSYRDHCTHIGRGGTPLEVIAELMGRVAGCSKGKGGSMHMYNKASNFYGGNGIVGAQTPLGAGLAFGQKYSNVPGVTLALYGDGAANQGQLFEAMNISALWDLPVIYVCENNHYGMGTAEWRAAKSPEFYCRGDYVPGLKVDGMDALAVKQAVAFAKAHALKNGPIVLEMDTYRYHGHSMSDPGSTYRTREEISGVRQERDPIERIRKLLLSKEIVSTAELKSLEKEAKASIDSDIEKAKASPFPESKELYTDTFVNNKNTVFYGCDRKVDQVVL
eukprot:TRINITY_DN78224_c0_g1_i1.p1 TRINITY_DN78224_c0_g1~~TRINITY_DN78224_c0_g1_i1.p1  ORF type:complete len:420 (+),score=30.18 TRINITY_DN78224_c0_g1_i1:145-1404(+)